MYINVYKKGGRMIKLKNKYACYRKRDDEGTFFKEESKTDRSQAEDSQIKSCIEKYGMAGLLAQAKAKEPIYCDMTKAVTIENALSIRKEVNDYFANMPAKARKQFGDNPELFYEKYKRGEFKDFIEVGAMTDELADYYTKELRKQGAINEKERNVNNYNTSNTNVNKIDNTDGNAV